MVVSARVLAEPREWSEGFAISKDGRRVLAATVDGIWAYDTATGARSRVTNGRTDLSPTWVGLDAIAFVRTEANEPVIVLKQLTDGSERVLARRARFPHVTDDRRRIGFNVDDGIRDAVAGRVDRSRSRPRNPSARRAASRRTIPQHLA